jgi:hypothetical protein
MNRPRSSVTVADVLSSMPLVNRKPSCAEPWRAPPPERGGDDRTIQAPIGSSDACAAADHHRIVPGGATCGAV